MERKINIFYKDTKGQTHYLFTTATNKLIKDVLERVRNYFSVPYHVIPFEKKIGEQLILTKIFAKIEKSL